MTPEEILLAREKKRDHISLNHEKIKYAENLKKHFSKELTTPVEEQKKESKLKIFWRNVKKLL